MRVLHVHSGNMYGGVETALVNMALTRTELPEMEPHYAICYEGRLGDELRGRGVPVTVLGEVRARNPFGVHRARKRLENLITRDQPDVAVCHAPWALAIFGPAVRAAGTPLAFFLHGSTEGKHWLERWARRIPPDVALCSGRFTIPSLSALAPTALHRVAHYPIPPPSPLAEEQRLQLRRSLDTSPTAPVIIQASRLDPWKGHELHIEALALIDDIDDWRCWFAGGAQNRTEEEYAARLQRLVSDRGIEGRVRFLGQRSDVAKLMAAADIHCQPNTGPEPFGIVFVEALYAGLPVVTPGFGGPLEIIDSSCGVLTPPGDVTSVAEALRRLLQNPTIREQMAAAAPARAAAICGPAIGLRELHDALASVVPSA